MRLFTIGGRDIVWNRHQPEERNQLALPFQEYVNWLSFNGNNYPFQVLRQTLNGNREEFGGDWGGLTHGALCGNSVAFSCMNVRLMHFAQGRFTWRNKLTGALFGTPELGILETPWENATTSDLLAAMIQDVDLAGNAYITRDGDYLARLRPDWVTILLGSRRRRDDWVPGDPDTHVAGYVFLPGGKGSGNEPRLLMPEQVAHFYLLRDPNAMFRGMSWLTPVIREIQADSQMTTHKAKFLDNGATVNLVVKVPATTVDTFNQWVERIQEGHQGVANAYRTLFLAGGADATAIGSDMQQMDFRNVQAAGELRIASAAGPVPPVMLGLSDAMQGSSLNDGNFRAAARMFGNGVIRPLWANAAGCLQHLLNVPAGAELWYDDRQVAFLKEDIADAAAVRASDMSAINTGLMAGFKADATVKAVTSGDLTTLVGQHTDLLSVQLLPPGTGTNENGNGNGNGNMPALMSGGTQ